MKTEVRFLVPEEWERYRRLRQEVFVKEQGFPAEEEFDEFDLRDAPQRHIVLLADGVLVGAARIRVLEGTTAKYQRICLQKDMRSKGLGRVLMEGIDVLACRCGYTAAVLSAQQYARGFYERCGFRVDSEEVFYECDQPHLHMSKKLNK